MVTEVGIIKMTKVKASAGTARNRMENMEVMGVGMKDPERIGTRSVAFTDPASVSALPALKHVQSLVSPVVNMNALIPRQSLSPVAVVFQQVRARTVLQLKARGTLVVRRGIVLSLLAQLASSHPMMEDLVFRPKPSPDLICYLRCIALLEFYSDLVLLLLGHVGQLLPSLFHSRYNPTLFDGSVTLYPSCIADGHGLRL